ncbi:MAG TPA: BatD family protein [Burkholderiaceae bacterium]|nr:BatD family protein [Burkholderiaceae bacterium]
MVRAGAATALVLPTICAATVQSEIDSTSVTVGEPFALSIEGDGAKAGAQPDLAPLRKDFAVLGSEASSETSIVDGTRTDRMKWIVRLQPLHAGRVEIPALSVGTDQTAPIELTVGVPSAAAEAALAQHAFMEVDTIPAGQSPYVQQQLPYTVRLYVDGDVRSGSLNAPDAGPEAVVEQLGKDKRYTASRHGRDYTVIERQYAISPEKSGALKISPATFQGTVEVPAAPGSGAVDPAEDLMARMMRNSPFANDPLFRNGLLGNLASATTTRTLTAQGPALAVDVRGRPAAAKVPWLPAEQVTLHDSWADAPPAFQVGEPVTRVITIETKGLAGSRIPTLAPSAPDHARVYPESAVNLSHVEGTSIDGESKQTLTYIPSAGGALDIPALALPWWDTGADAPRSAVLPELRFQVAPGAAGAAEPTPASPAARATAQPSTVPVVAAPIGDAWHALQMAAARAATPVRWVGLAALLIGLAAFLATVIRRARRRKGDSAPAPRQVDIAQPTPARVTDRKSSLRALREACLADDAPAAARAVLSLARVEWPDDAPRGLASLAARLEKGAPEVTELDRCLYAASATAWKGDALWAEFKGGLPVARATPSPPRRDIDDLYRDAGVAI